MLNSANAAGRFFCLSCWKKSVIGLLYFESQSPCNRFPLVDEQNVLDSYLLALGQCVECGLVQLLDPISPRLIRTPHAWLTYSEPEGHLDVLVNFLSTMISPDAKIFALTYKDDSTLDRFNRLGYPHTFRYDMKLDLDIDDECAGLETVQSVINDNMADGLVAKYGEVDLLIVRHVLEHAHAPACFLQSLRRLLSPCGRIVFEVPDCRKFIDACDYSFIWEEHISYFSPFTLESFARSNGFNVLETLVYSYSLEDSLVAVMQPAKDDVFAVDQEILTQELIAGQHFTNKFNVIRLSYQNHFESLHKAGKRIAVFGAGHLAAKFLNLFGLEDDVDFVIDDNPHKQGLAMPGSGLPIVGSSRLSEVDLCMLSLSPESEQKVLAKQRDYLQAGGHFASIFARSSIALKLV